MNKPQTVKKKSWNKKQFIFYLTCFDFKNALNVEPGSNLYGAFDNGR